MTSMPDDFEGARVTGAPENEASADEIPFEADIKVIRSLATVLPGARHTATNPISVAESVRLKRFIVAGGGATSRTRCPGQPTNSSIWTARSCRITGRTKRPMGPLAKARRSRTTWINMTSCKSH